MQVAQPVQAILETLLNREPMPALRPTGIWKRELDEQLSRWEPEELFARPVVRSDFARAFLAGLHQWNDNLEVSHTLAMSEGAKEPLGRQTLDYWHGIMHRREPDYPNAKYWFRRVGEHSLFPTLLESAQAALRNSERNRDTVARELLSWNRWDAFQFVDWCQQYAGTGSEEERTLQLVQALEMRRLLEFCADRATTD
ncbi:MAG: hypothetical protein KatS3mg115_2118 [Candidatus Poribacteria bacterium]|nr:MAG: hypothetical protein KatS3mg115_2118 [Candidatus Poribacteria bacterium]